MNFKALLNTAAKVIEQHQEEDLGRVVLVVADDISKKERKRMKKSRKRYLVLKIRPEEKNRRSDH